MKIIHKVGVYRLGILFSSFLFVGIARPCDAQSKLSLQEAVDLGLKTRASLKAEAQLVSAAQGLQRQAEVIQNPTFQFENQNLRPGQIYVRDVDTYAYLTQPLDVLGKRKQRIAVATKEVANTQAKYELVRRQIAQDIKRSYWIARGAQEVRDLLNSSVENFQKILGYHSAQLTVGAISEQDFLRIRLEDERLKIAANLAVLEATRTRVQLQREMGQRDFPDLRLAEPLDAIQIPIASGTIQQVLAQRIEMRVANAALESAQAKARLEEVAARPDLSVEFGYKRTQLVDATAGTNSALAGVQITLPLMDRNQGNRAAANAEVLRQEQLLAETQANVLADYYSALQEYELRAKEVSGILQPLREHAKEVSEISQAAYAQGGTDLLRLLDGERARLDAEVGYVQGMIAYQQSIVDLEAAEGATP